MEMPRGGLVESVDSVGCVCGNPGMVANASAALAAAGLAATAIRTKDSWTGPSSLA